MKSKLGPNGRYITYAYNLRDACDTRKSRLAGKIANPPSPPLCKEGLGDHK